MGTPIKFGTEFLINTTTVGYQSYPALTALADGRFVAAWTDQSDSGGDASSSAIRAQVFNADGSKLGAEFLVNTTTASYQLDPALTALADGRFVVVWTDESLSIDDASGDAARGQVFNADGSKSGTEFLVNTTTTGNQRQPTLTALADGRFVASWADVSASGDDTSFFAVRAQVFNADSSKSGAEFLVNTTTASFQLQPTLTALADGRFIAAWLDGSANVGDTPGTDIRAQIFNADGSKSGAEFLVNTTTAGNQLQPSLTALADGRFVIGWLDQRSGADDTSGWAVRAQVFNADGSKAGTEFLVNTTTANTQYQPNLTALADGRFVTAWTDFSASADDTSICAVRAQVFNADGSKSGVEFLVNTSTVGAQSIPTLISLADGRFVVGWAEEGVGDEDATFVRGQIFDPREAAVDLLGSVRAEQFVGTAFNDTLRGYLGDDRLDGAGGADRLFGEDGNDRVNGNLGDDTASGGTGNDTVTGGVGRDLLTGEAATIC